MYKKNLKIRALTGFFAIFLVMQPAVVLAHVSAEPARQINEAVARANEASARLEATLDGASAQVDTSTDNQAPAGATLTAELNKGLKKVEGWFAGVNWKQAGVTAASVAAVLAVYDVVKK